MSKVDINSSLFLYFNYFSFIVEYEVEVDNDPENPESSVNEGDGTNALQGEVSAEAPSQVDGEESSTAIGSHADDETRKTNTINPTSVTSEKSADVNAGKTETEGGESTASNELNTEENELIKPKKIMKLKKIESVDRFTLYISVNKMTAEMHDHTSIFFIRCHDGEVPILLDGADNSQYASHFEFSLLNGDVLFGIANLMHYIYLPTVHKPTNEDTALLIDEGLRHELNSNVTKFEHQLRHVVQQVRDDVRLSIPNVTINDPEAATEDYELVNQLESALEKWTEVVSTAVETEHHKNPQKGHRSPLSEIEFWRERNASLSALYEKINMPSVQQMLLVLKIMDNAQLATFNYHFGELSKLYLEAKDNVKFLTTLERHFKHITDGSFSTILDALPSMVNGLRMVWVISRHYNTDERMAPLMENIAETIARRVREEVKLSEVLAMDFPRAKQLIQEARDVLMQWSEHYYRMRKRIEDSGSDHRWEFDRKALFGKTDYMAEVCDNLLEIVEALDRFHKFLGPELKAVTGDSAGIDEVLKRVENLSVPLKVPFEDKIFEKNYEKPWEAIMKRFRQNVSEIDKMTEQFIKESFRKLRSAEGAFELVQSFQQIGGGVGGPPAVLQQGGAPSGGGLKLSDRYKDILEQYIRELEAVNKLFVSCKDRYVCLFLLMYIQCIRIFI